MHQLDRDLVLSFQSGDERAYAEIFKRYHGRVWGICKRMLPSTQDAEEATQETFLKAYQALGRFNGSFYLGAWLSRIATNVCVDHLRSKSKSNLVALSDEPDDLVTELGPEDIIVGDHPRLQRAIEEIQPLHASALALRALEGLSHQEIAGHLHMSPTQVKALLHRARCSLRKAWDKAEGWALAPIFAIRHLLPERSTGEATRLASISPSATPFIIERVAAASAIIVAAALTGLPSAHDVDSERSKPRSRAVAAPFRAQEANEAAGTSPGASIASTPTGSAARAAVAPPSAVAPAPVADLKAQIDKTLEDTKKKAQPPDEPPDDPPDDPLGPTAAQGQKAVKQVHKTVTEALNNVAP